MRITHKHILGYLTTKFNIHIVWYFATQSNNRRGKICSPKNLLIFLVLHFSIPPASTYYPTKISESVMWMRFSSGWLDVTAPTQKITTLLRYNTLGLHAQHYYYYNQPCKPLSHSLSTPCKFGSTKQVPLQPKHTSSCHLGINIA